MTTITTRSGKGSPLTNDEVDANFTNLNTDKVETSGDSMTGDLSFGDNVKATFGSDDLQIYHDGSNSYISDQGTGTLKIQGDSQVRLESTAGERYFVGNNNGASRLYYDDSEKLATTSTGIDVTGSVTADGLTVDGDGSFTGSFEISGLSPKIFLNETDTTDVNSRIRSAAGKLQIQTVDNSDSNPVTRFQIDHSTGNVSIPSGDLDVTGTVSADSGTIVSTGSDAFSAKAVGGYAIQAYQDATSSGHTALDLRSDATTGTRYLIRGYNDAAGTPTEVFSVGADGTVSADGLTVQGASDSTVLVEATSGNDASLFLTEAGTGNVGAQFVYDGGVNELFLKVGNNTDTTRLSVSRDTGDISFYEDTGTTAKLFWDASAETLAIGLSGANARLEVGAFATTASDIAYFSNSNGAHKAIIRLDAQGDGEFVLRDAGNNEDVVITAGGDSYFNGGNVGINTSSPARKLSVNSSSTQIAASFTSTSSTSARIGLVDANTTGDNYVNLAASGDAMALYAGASERVRITSGGNVGIGTDSPDELLHLSDTGGNAVLKFTRDDTTTTSGSSVGTIQFAHTDADDAGVAATIVGKATNAFGKVALLFATGNPTTKTERMRLDADGNLLVGTTSFTTTTAGIKLDADGDIAANRDGDAAAFFGRLTSDGEIVRFRKDGSTAGSIGTLSSALTIGTGDTGVQFNADTNAIMPHNTSTGANVDASIDIGYSSGGTNRRFKDLHLSGAVRCPDYRSEGVLFLTYDADDSLRIRRDNGSEAARFDSSSNLLVGRTSRLTSQAGSISSNTVLSAHGDLTAHQTSAVVLQFNSASNMGVIRSYGATAGTGGLRFNVGGGGGSADSEAMRIDSSGNLLVGTTSTSTIGTHSPNVISSAQFGALSGSNLATFGVDRIHFNTSNYYVLNAASVGVRLINGATAWTAQSDETLKENITELTDVLPKVQNLRCVSYNLKSQSSDNVKLGFIAQDWQTEFPEVVHDEPSDGTLGINYTETIPVLLKAIQEQNELINDLRARVAQLEGAN